MWREFKWAGNVHVAGGGLSGVSGALPAPRGPAKLSSIQDCPILGGNASSETRKHVVGADYHGARGISLASATRDEGLRKYGSTPPSKIRSRELVPRL